MQDWSTMKKLIWLRSATPKERTYGPDAIVTFNTATAKAMKSLLVSMAPIQELNGYDNPWSAGGGKNKCPQESTQTSHQVTFTALSDGGYALSGTATGGNAVLDIGRGSWSLPAGTYYASLTGTSNAANTMWKVVNGTASMLVQGDGSFTLTETAEVFFRLYIDNGTTATGNAYAQVESGSSATSFSPYSNICPITGRTGLSVYVSPTQNIADATTYAVDWTSEAGTVYGGTVDVVTGVLTVTMAYLGLSGRTWTMTTETGGNVFSCNALTGTNGKALNYNFVCNKYKAVAKYRSQLVSGEIGTYNGTNGRNRFSICDNNYSTVEGFVASISDLYVCYELATPLTYNLTAQEVTTLVGANNVLSDSGDVTVVV